MNKKTTQFSQFFKNMRKKTNLTQQLLADKAGVGLRFIRDVEQGKHSIRLDSVNKVLSLFGYCAGPVKIEREGERDAQGQGSVQG